LNRFTFKRNKGILRYKGWVVNVKVLKIVNDPTQETLLKKSQLIRSLEENSVNQPSFRFSQTPEMDVLNTFLSVVSFIKLFLFKGKI
jgi:hypothetical protein